MRGIVSRHRNLLAAFLLAPSVAFSQTSQQPKKIHPDVVAFDRMYEQFRTMTRDLEILRQKHRYSREKDRSEIAKQFAELLKTATALEPQLKPAAEKAVVVDPDRNKMHTKYIHKMVVEYYLYDRNTAEVDRLASLLLKHGIEIKEVLEFAGHVAFLRRDHKKSVEYLRKSAPDGRRNPFIEPFYREAIIRVKEEKSNDLPRVKFETTQGAFVVELYENEAPNTVANFMALVSSGFYNGRDIVHQRPRKKQKVRGEEVETIMADFVTSGAPTARNPKPQNFFIPCECYRKDFRRVLPFSLIMVLHGQRDSGSATFLISLMRTPELARELDGKYTVFGRVIEGFGTVGKINLVPLKPQQTPVTRDHIVNATITRKMKTKLAVKRTLRGGVTPESDPR